jgi:HSP20 family protein
MALSIFNRLDPFWGELNAPISRVQDTLLIDLSENDSKVFLRASLPGVNKSDIKITYDSKNITISAESFNKQETKDSRYYYSEHSYGKVSRTVRLPPGSNPAQSTCKYENGILDIEIPKVENDVKEITIN